MKKLTLASAIILSTLAFTACTKENVAPKAAATHSATTTADKANLGQADFSQDGTTPPVEDKANLGQADYSGGN